MAADNAVAGAAASNPNVFEPTSSGDEGSESYSRKPNMVTLPRPEPLVLPQLQVQSEQSEHSNFLLWQVYAFGGYIVIKWLWGKWNERQNQKGNPDK